jgi:MFS family permease
VALGITKSPGPRLTLSLFVGFTRDTGLSPGDLNTSLAFFFAFFVALQPVGAALGRKYGMGRWVPACMILWGIFTLLHIWVRRRWQLILLRVLIATLEAGFYPTTVSYLSLFYTRYEFAVRLGFFYGQSAVAGVVGGVLSWAVFKRFPEGNGGGEGSSGSGVAVGDGWKSWEVLFMIEGCVTMVVALVGFWWLPHSAGEAWFFTARERRWAEERIRIDRDEALHATSHRSDHSEDSRTTPDQTWETERQPRNSTELHDDTIDDRAHLLEPGHRTTPRLRKMSTVSTISLTADAGLSKHDMVSAVAQWKIWHLLVCNILSAIPATAFSVFLPLVMKQLSPRLNLSPAASNLLSAPPFACGAIVLFLFTRWSDRSHRRLVPILWGLAILLVGLTLTVMTPVDSYVLRYTSLCVLLSGSFIASPLTVAWLTNNTPEPGKRAILLGINGWGNLAGVFSALLFTPDDEREGYVKPFVITLVCVGMSFAGFAVFRWRLIRENFQRDKMVASWGEEERQREDLIGDVEVSNGSLRSGGLLETVGGIDVLDRLGLRGVRRGDDKLTFRYGL